MKEERWFLLIRNIEKGPKIGDFVLAGAEEEDTIARKILFLIDMVSPILFVLKRPVKIKIEENKLWIFSEDFKLFKEIVNKNVSNYVWLTTFLKNTQKLLQDVEKDEFKIELGQRIELEGRLFLTQLFLLPKTLQIYEQFCGGEPSPKPVKPSYNTFLSSEIAKHGLEKVAEKHPFVKMLTVWKGISYLKNEFDDSLKNLYDEKNRELKRYYHEKIREIVESEEEDYQKSIRLFLFSTISHMMTISEWENYYTFNTRESALSVIKNILEKTKDIQQVVEHVIEKEMRSN